MRVVNVDFTGSTRAYPTIRDCLEYTTVNQSAPPAPWERSAPATRRGRDRADEILRVSLRLFRERGYHAVGIDEIGAAVGVTGPALYRHFPSKEALLVAAAWDSIEHVQVALERASRSEGDDWQRLAAVIRSMIHTTFDDRDLISVYSREVRHISGEQRALVGERQRQNNDYWLNALAPCFPGLSARSRLFMVQTLAGLAISFVNGKPGVAREQLETLLTEASIAALRGGAAEIPPGELGRPSSHDPVVEADGSGRGARSSRREVILLAAIPLFSERGYGGVGVDEIGAAAGIAGPGVYRHWRNKEEILVAAFNRWQQLASSGVNQALNAGGTPEDIVASLVDEYVRLVADDPALTVLYLSDSHALPEVEQAVFRREQQALVDDWVTVLRQSRPEMSAAEARVVVHGAMGLVHGYAFGKLRLDGVSERRVLAAMTLAALIPPLDA